MFRLETTRTTGKDNLYLVRGLTYPRFFYLLIKSADGHGRVRPCAKEKLFQKCCFQKSKDSPVNYFRYAKMRILCGKFLSD